MRLVIAWVAIGDARRSPCGEVDLVDELVGVAIGEIGEARDPID